MTISIFVGIDEHNNIGESQYTVKVIGVEVIGVEDYEDRTRNDELIKKALKVTIEFGGLIGVSSYDELPENLLIDQWKFENERASFLIDYLQ